MKRKLGRWLAYGLIAAVLVIVAFILSLDAIARFVAERRVRAETGMETSIGKFTVGLKSSTIHIQNFVLKNPAEFGGDTFVEMPELFLDYDHEALRAGKLHLNLVRIDIAKVHVVENKDGKRNVDELQKHQRRSKTSHGSTNQSEAPFIFDGLDQLEVTLKTAQFTSFKNPSQNLEQDLGIRHEIFKNLKSEKDFQTAAALIALKAGAGLLLNGELTNPAQLLLGGSNAGQETKKVLEGMPLPNKPQPAATP
jgi:uncharacterized protein involved in outer membrane biogenesis